MSRTLTPDTTLEILKKDAKRWLKALRAGDAGARDRLLAATPAAPAFPGLRDVQFALAREYGLAGWSALREALEDLALARRSDAERTGIVLHSAWQGDRAAAARILARWPQTGAGGIRMAVATGNLAEVRRQLAADPTLAARKGGPLDWEPLLYLAYARLPGGERNGPEMARLLLDHGADPNARFDDGWGNPFTVLTGIIGEGEGDKPPHPQAADLADLLVERGADPFDTQALYNTSITRDETRWLDFLWTRCARRGTTDLWHVPGTPGIGGKISLSPLDYLLGNAVAYNHLLRAEWLVVHGANADGVHAYSGRPLREEALIHGHVEMADLLARHGAATPPLTGQAAFQAAIMQLDRAAAQAAAHAHPECLRDAAPMLIAARRGRADMVALLLDLGMDADVMDETEQRGLHNAAGNGALEVARLLIARGADIDRPTTRFGGPMGFAAHFGHREMAALLAPLSRDVVELTYLGMKERVRELLAADPSLANAAQGKYGIIPLFALPDDDAEAVEMAELLLSFGADPNATNNEGLTAEQAARTRGLIDAADLMRGEAD
ncbi:ankyrin repeat domain-containing protein [Aquabacter sp. CN5-332]|uniref:ankyrin repeat domain-containing protein n=1 Tax=Aquabacter sp. CN5-332 TaxID=3156608 RepID=UPI0032B56B56